MTADPRPPVQAPARAPSVIDWTRWSVIYLKPDCLERGLVGEVLARIARHVQVSAVRQVRVTRTQIYAHYTDLFPRQEEIGVDIAAELDRMHVGKLSVVALGHGPSAAARLRDLIGPTDPAQAGPDTIRGHYGIDTLAHGQAEHRLINNLIHTSDDPEAARRDFFIWFGPGTASLDLLTDPRPYDPDHLPQAPEEPR